MLQACLAIGLACAMLAEAEDPTCGHCRCREERRGTPHLIVNCSDDTYFPGRLRVPKLAPGDAALPVWAEFNRNRYTHVGDDFLLAGTTRLSLADNLIFNVSGRAFSSFPELQFLSLAHNSIADVDADTFFGLGSLQELDLSHNLLVKVPEGTFSELASLTVLNLAANQLEAIGPKFFQGLDRLRAVDLSSNDIVDITPASLWSLTLLEHLNLAGNILADVNGRHLAGLQSLKSLDLSRNYIWKMEPDVLKAQGSLQKLVLAKNSLTETILVPSSVTHLDLTDNHMQGVEDMWRYLDNLVVLHVANTSIDSVDGCFNFTNLQELNISDNALRSFQVESLPAARVVDLSWNNLTSVPDDVTSAKLPSLQELYLDGNPIQQLVFPQPRLAFQDLRLLSLSEDLDLESLGEDMLAGVTHKLTTLRISHNPLLGFVHEKAFAGVVIDELDLSWNALSSLPQDLVAWSQLQSVDLQHNPWNCACPMQWLLDDVVSHLYVSRQDLLYELRCASPAPLRDRRMVHFYNWTKKAFCMQFEQLRVNSLDGIDSTETATMGTSTTAIIIVLSLLAALIVLIAVGVVVQRRILSRQRHKNRRF